MLVSLDNTHDICYLTILIFVIYYRLEHILCIAFIKWPSPSSTSLPVYHVFIILCRVFVIGNFVCGVINELQNMCLLN